MYQIFLKIYNYFNSRTVSAISLFILFLSVTLFFISKLQFEEDISQLLPSGARQNILKKVLDETDFSDKVIVSISAKSEETSVDELSREAEKLIDSLKFSFGNYIEEIQGKVPEENVLEVYDFVYANLPIFLNSSDYNVIENRIQPDSIRKRVKDNYKNLISPTGLVTKEFLFKDPLSITTLGLQKLRELQVGEGFELHNDFITTADKKHVLLFLDAKNPSSEIAKNQEFANKLKTLTNSLNQQNSNIEIDFFGGFLYGIANASQIKKDIQLTLGIAVSILLILLIVFYRRILVPLILFVPSICGALLALTVLYFLREKVSAISLGMGAILLGISLDYALHILTHYRNNNNIKKLYQDLSKPILMSSCTTAIAFLCLLFIKSEALKDLGIFAAVGVLGSSVFALILIPLLYKVPKNNADLNSGWLDKLAAIRFYKKKPLVLVLVLLFTGTLFFFGEVQFNSDISKLNYEPKDLKETEEKVMDIAGRSAKSVYLISYGNSIDEALFTNNELYENLRKFKENGKIKTFSSIGGVVLSSETQSRRISNWGKFWSPAKKSNVEDNLVSASSAYGFKPESFQYFYRQLDKDFNEIFLNNYRQVSGLYLDDFISESENFFTVTTTVQIEEDRAEAFTAAFPPEEGVVAIDRKQINETFLGNLKNDFNRLISFSIIAVFIMLLLFYRNLELSLLTLFPIAITWVIAIGIMAIFSIEFNVLNIIISTFIFGLGLDYSIFITNACLREFQTGEKVLPTYQTSILLSLITTLLGMGALIFAGHPALQSVSMVSVIGVVTAVLVAFIIQAKFYELLFFNRKKSGRPPLSFSALFLKSKSEEKLYRRRSVLSNYRFKPEFRMARSEFNREKERYLKISGFIDPEDKILILDSGFGILPVFLSYKNEEAEIWAWNPSKVHCRVAENTHRNFQKCLNFTTDISSALPDKNVFIFSTNTEVKINSELKKEIIKQAKTVVFLNSEMPHRWLIDADFKIVYRQNKMLIFQKAD